MSDARVFRCPNCGGPVDALERLCGYCSAPVATVRCARCYQMNVPDAAHCMGCGHPLGLEPAGAPDFLRCPRCAVDFEAFRGNTGKLHDCGRCGGQFVEHMLLRDLIERREVYGSVAPRIVRKANPLNDPVHYVPCPECRKLMSRRNFGGASGVIVDVCAPHGIWFDTGELPQVLSFVENGGLLLARRREIEEEERRRRAASIAVPFSTRTPSHDLPLSGEEVLMNAATQLLEFLAGLLPDARR